MFVRPVLPNQIALARSRTSIFSRQQTGLSAAGTSLVEIRQRYLRDMQEQYPGLLSRRFNGKVVYTAQGIAPDEMVRQGGFIAQGPLWLSNTGSGDNRGSVCLTFLPEVAAIFARGSSDAYLYAIPLHGEFLLPGGCWRQVISPGALPVGSGWLARRVECIEQDGRIHFGPLLGCLDGLTTEQGERFEAFLDNKLILPAELETGSDYPAEYDIQDTDYTAKVQETLKDHCRLSRRTMSYR